MKTTLTLTARILKVNWLFTVALLGILLPILPYDEVPPAMILFISTCVLSQVIASCGMELKALSTEQHAYVIPHYKKSALQAVSLVLGVFCLLLAAHCAYRGIHFTIAFLTLSCLSLAMLIGHLFKSQLIQVALWFALTFSIILVMEYDGSDTINQYLMHSSNSFYLLALCLVLYATLMSLTLAKRDITENKGAGRQYYWNSMISLTGNRDCFKTNLSIWGGDRWFLKQLKSPLNQMLYSVFYRDFILIFTLTLTSTILVALSGQLGWFDNSPQYAFISLLSMILLGLYCLFLQGIYTKKSHIKQLWLSALHASSQKAAKQYLCKFLLMGITLPFALSLILIKPIQAQYSTAPVDWYLYLIILTNLIAVNFGLSIYYLWQKEHKGLTIMAYLAMFSLLLMFVLPTGIDFATGAEIKPFIWYFMPLTLAYAYFQYMQLMKPDTEWASF